MTFLYFHISENLMFNALEYSYKVISMGCAQSMAWVSLLLGRGCGLRGLQKIRQAL